jgi:hypothetical protein
VALVLEVAPVRVDHEQQRDLVVGRGPQGLWRVQEVAIALEVDDDPAAALVGEPGPE